MTVIECIEEFLKRFPETRDSYEKNMDDYVGYDGKPLGHVFFGDMIDIPLTKLLKTNTDKELIQKYIDFLNFMQQEERNPNNQDDVQNILAVTIMEYLGDDETVLRNAFTYFTEELMIVSKDIEKSWGRRDITIYYRRGNVFGRW